MAYQMAWIPVTLSEFGSLFCFMSDKMHHVVPVYWHGFLYAVWASL